MLTLLTLVANWLNYPYRLCASLRTNYFLKKKPEFEKQNSEFIDQILIQTNGGKKNSTNLQDGKPRWMLSWT